MARKFNSPEISPTTASIAAINLRLAAIQLAGLRPPVRARKIQPVRRRLLVTMVATQDWAVKIGQPFQNLGTPVSETLPVQSPRV